MPFKSKKQRAYLAINKPKIYKKWKGNTGYGDLRRRETTPKREGPPLKNRPLNYWDDVGFAYQRPHGLINAPIRRDTRRKQLAEEQARRTYQGLLERDLIGIQQFSPFFGLNTRDPDAIPVAPMDVVPGGLLGKGVLAAGVLGGLAKRAVVPGVKRGEEMVVTHNLTPDNLAHAERMGGLPMPSLGVAKTGQPIEGYGDIVLIGDKQMAKSSARNPVAPADSYTVRYPKVLQDINKKSEADALELFTAPIREIDPKLADEVLSKPWRLFDDPGELHNYWPSKALFLKDIGRENVLRRALRKRYGKDDNHTINSLLTDEIREAGFIEDWYDYSDKLVDRLRQSGVRIDERIFKGFTPAGNRRYAAHTLDNVMKEMRWEARDAYHGASMYGMGAIRARIAPRFKNLKAVVEARGRLVGDDEFKKAKEEIETAFIKLSEKLGKHRKGYDPKDFGMLDRVGEDLIDYSRRGRRGLDDFYDDVPEALLKEMDELVTAIKKMPTEYFEVKPNRIMQVDEFSGALVPDDVGEDVIARLNRMGVNRIEKYSRPSMTSKSGKSKALDKFQDMMFGAAPLGLIGLEEDREGLLR